MFPIPNDQQSLEERFKNFDRLDMHPTKFLWIVTLKDGKQHFVEVGKLREWLATHAQ